MICRKPIMQGDQYYLPFKVKINGEKIKIDEISAIEFTVGNMKKYYENNVREVQYLEDEDVFIFPLSETETINLRGPQKMQIRIKGNDDVVIGKIIGDINIQYSSSKEIL